MVVLNVFIFLFVSYIFEIIFVFVCKKNEEYFDDLMYYI